MATWHVTCAADGRMRLFPDETSLRAAVRTIARVVGRRSLLFCVADEHVHLVLDGERRATGHRAGGVVRALNSLRPGARLEGARVRPVADRGHLTSLIRYLCAQPAHHGLPGHPALWTGSCFPDLVGARALDGYDGGLLRRALPRWRSSDTARCLGLRSSPAPASDDELATAGLDRVLAAAAAAFAAPPSLLGRTSAPLRARRAGAALARRVGIRAPAVAGRLGSPPATCAGWRPAARAPTTSSRSGAAWPSSWWWRPAPAVRRQGDGAAPPTVARRPGTRGHSGPGMSRHPRT